MSDHAEHAIERDLLTRAEALSDRILTELEQSVQAGGQKLVKFTCSNCGRAGSASVRALDPEDARRLFDSLTGLSHKIRTQRKESAGSSFMSQAIERGMSDEELERAFRNVSDEELESTVYAAGADAGASPATTDLSLAVSALTEVQIREVATYAASLLGGTTGA